MRDVAKLRLYAEILFRLRVPRTGRDPSLRSGLKTKFRSGVNPKTSLVALGIENQSFNA